MDIVRSEIDKALSANAASIRGVFSDARSTPCQRLEDLRCLCDGVVHSGRDHACTASLSAARSAAFPAAPRTCGRYRGDPSRSGVHRVPELDSSRAHRPLHLVLGGVLGLQPSGPASKDPSLTSTASFFPNRRATQISQICLRIEGTRIMPDGDEVSFAAGTTCQVQEPEFAIDVPPWWEPLTLPIWRPDLDETIALRDAIAGHVGVQRDAPGQEPVSWNALVYFADWRSEKPLEALSAALSQVRNSSAPMVIVVLPAGAFDSSRREFESRLPSAAKRRPHAVQFTEDDEGGWTRMFAVAKTPSVYLINAKGEFVWKHEGEPDPAALAAALDRAPRAASGAALSSAAADRFTRRSRRRTSTFEDDRRTPVRASSFPRTRRAVELLAVVVGAVPHGARLACNDCIRLAENRPLSSRSTAARTAMRLMRFASASGLSFPLVQDSQQRIARRYGVRCWPTTIIGRRRGTRGARPARNRTWT